MNEGIRILLLYNLGFILYLYITTTTTTTTRITVNNNPIHPNGPLLIKEFIQLDLCLVGLISLLFLLFSSSITPLILYLTCFSFWLFPFNLFFTAFNLRWKFFRALIRVCSPSLNQNIQFTDILLADFLTSYARVFADMYSSLQLPISKDYLWIKPFIISLPYMIRFRQCCAEYYQHHHQPDHKQEQQLNTYIRIPTSNKSKHLCNALKYLSAIPMITMSAIWHANQPPSFIVISLWVIFALVNTLYSYYWDVLIDWGLGVRPSRDLMLGNWPVFTRPVRMFSSYVYYIAIVSDFILRFLWTLRLSSSQSISVTMLCVLEIGRRAGWCVLRIEREFLVDSTWKHVSMDDLSTPLPPSPSSDLTSSPSRSTPRFKL